MPRFIIYLLPRFKTAPFWAAEMARKGTFSRAGNLSWVPRIHRVERADPAVVLALPSHWPSENAEPYTLCWRWLSSSQEH